MKSNELMIGDWVICKDYPMIPSLIKLKAEHFVRSLCEFEPIPLTAEILEKNGFVVEPRYCYDEPLQYCEIVDGLWINISGENYFEGKLEYVHELQHALRLCGLTELADNFKV